MTVRNVGTVGLVPQIATGAGTPEGTSLHTGLGGTVPPPHHTGTNPSTGQALNFTIFTPRDPAKQIFCWIPGPSAAV